MTNNLQRLADFVSNKNENDTETIVCKECGCEKSITHFKKTRWGTYAQVCNECATIKRMATIKEMKQQRVTDNENKVEIALQMRLKDFTPRELMQELAARGYVGTLEYTEVHRIDITQM